MQGEKGGILAMYMLLGLFFKSRGASQRKARWSSMEHGDRSDSRKLAAASVPNSANCANNRRGEPSTLPRRTAPDPLY
jgi:hypothetical protein